MKHILIVDDNADQLEMFGQLLKAAHYSCATAYNINTIYKQLEARLPDLILLDVLLQGEDGREICRELKATDSYGCIPVILMSASLGRLQNYRDMGADDFMEKPFEMDELLEKIEFFAERRRITA